MQIFSNINNSSNLEFNDEVDIKNENNPKTLDNCRVNDLRYYCD